MVDVEVEEELGITNFCFLDCKVVDVTFCLFLATSCCEVLVERFDLVGVGLEAVVFLTTSDFLTNDLVGLLF